MGTRPEDGNGLGLYGGVKWDRRVTPNPRESRERRTDSEGIATAGSGTVCLHLEGSLLLIAIMAVTLQNYTRKLN